MRLPASISSLPATTCLTILGILVVNSARAASQLELMESEVTALYQKSREAIVKVHAEGRHIRRGLTVIPWHRIGTGFFIDETGGLLTAATVVENSDTCWIEWRERKVIAKLLGLDRQTQVALLQVDPADCVAEGQKLPFLAQGNSDELQVGSMVVAIGFPYDLPSSPTVGFVGGFDIKCGSRMFVTSHFRAGCRLSPGQGGGPLLNTRGEVVGLAVAAHGTEQCYALPINAARKVVADILQHGRVQYGWVGLEVGEQRQRWPEAGLEESKVCIRQVYSNSPAATAGFRCQDVLLKICSNDIRRTADVLNTMFQHRCGERISFTVLRSGETQQVTLVIGQRPAPETAIVQSFPPAPQPAKPTAGLNVVPVSGPQP